MSRNAGFKPMESLMMEMMNSMTECGSHGWLMIAGGVVFYSVLGLAGAALVKYLFFEGRARTAAQ
jgi:hypothetical protein